METKSKILVVDDQIGMQGSLHQKAFLRAYGGLPFEFSFESCENGRAYAAERGIDTLRENPDTDLVLLDIKFGKDDELLGYEILPMLTAQFPSVPVLVMSSVDRDIESLGRCLEDGAVGFVTKDLKADAFERAIKGAVSVARSHVLLGQTAPLRELRRQAARLSPYDQIPVMIMGERGTGKERVARYIHHNGPRSSGPFVAVNCAGLSESLLEAELFGAEKGAYTGATSTRIGYLERANHGVLFLDEIGNMPLSTQAKLLRALQDKSFRRVGVSEAEITSDFQVICATNVDPAELVAEGRLREDFYDRVAAVAVKTPPLRDCREDIPELGNHFLRELGLQNKKRLSSQVLRTFNDYVWPGNVRELNRAVQQAVVLSENARVIELAHLPDKYRPPALKSIKRNAANGISAIVILADDPSTWPRERLLSELRLCVEAKVRIQRYKGKQWKAEFMRLMYPHCKAQNAKGFNDLIRRLTKGPWGMQDWTTDQSLSALLKELQE